VALQDDADLTLFLERVSSSYQKRQYTGLAQMLWLVPIAISPWFPACLRLL
jgi:hypothetical protein